MQEDKKGMPELTIILLALLYQNAALTSSLGGCHKINNFWYTFSLYMLYTEGKDNPNTFLRN